MTIQMNDEHLKKRVRVNSLEEGRFLGGTQTGRGGYSCYRQVVRNGVIYNLENLDISTNG